MYFPRFTRSQSKNLVWIYNPHAGVYERNNNYVFNMHPRNCLNCMCRKYSCVCDSSKPDIHTHIDFRYKPDGIGIMPARKKNDYIKIIYKKRFERSDIMKNKLNKKHVSFSRIIEMVFIPHFTQRNERFFSDKDVINT